MRAVENWTAIDVWKPSVGFLALAPWAREALPDEIRCVAKGAGPAQGTPRPAIVLLSLVDGSGMAR
eukprot:3182253-Lingulodinium_polyedra.AAC.1